MSGTSSSASRSIAFDCLSRLCARGGQALHKSGESLVLTLEQPLGELSLSFETSTGHSYATVTRKRDSSMEPSARVIVLRTS